MRTSSDIRPAVILALGNGAYHYNYNITERTEKDPETEQEKTIYDCDTVKIWGEPTYEKIAKAVIREKLDETAEFAIINEYYAGVLGVTTDSTEKAAAKQAYKEYLEYVVSVKAMIKADLAAAGY